MNITTLSRITLDADDLLLLDKMAAAAGKSRDAFISNVMNEMVKLERDLVSDGPHEHSYTRKPTGSGE